MNNSQVSFDSVPDEEQVREGRAEKLNEREGTILRVIEAIEAVAKTEAWSTLKTEILDRLAISLQKDLLAEAKKEDPDPKKLNRLAGELKWAARYSDLSKLSVSFKLELQSIRTQKNA